MSSDGADESSSTRNRMAKFAFVGAIGIAIQLLVLHWLVTVGCGYLISTAIAVETAILHNFVWHENFTWRERSPSGSDEIWARLLRFHLSNGLISIIGNLLLMRVFVGWLSLNVVAANLLSVTICCVTNFLASDRWVFIPSAS